MGDIKQPMSLIVSVLNTGQSVGLGSGGGGRAGGGEGSGSGKVECTGNGGMG